MPISGPNDIERMQRDAEHRIREMQKRADRAVRGNDMPPVPNFVRMNQGRQQNRNQNRKGNFCLFSQGEENALYYSR